MHRCFIALELDEDVKRTLKASVEPFKRASRADKPRLVDTSGYHVTLKFLGAVSSQRLAEVRQGLAQALAVGTAVTTEWAGFGGFPRRAKANVLIAVLRDDRGQLSELYESTEQACAALGFAREARSFKPHVTLARFRTSIDLRPYLTGVPPAARVSLTAVALYESLLAPGGASYSVIERYPLIPEPPEPEAEPGPEQLSG